MAGEAKDIKLEKKRLNEERKQLKKESVLQKKEVKARVKEISAKEAAIDDEDEGGGFTTFMATVLIVALWIAIFIVLVKLDVGGLGTNIMKPLIQDIPVLNLMLPSGAITETDDEEGYGGYSSLKSAVEQIHALELENQRLQSNQLSKDEEITTLMAEIKRLEEFESKQVEFQRIKTEFYEEVVYAENGPGAEEYQKYFESMDQATAEYIYKQVITQLEESAEIQDYALAYSEMKAKEAAAIFESMTDNINLAARILGVMNASDRGSILGAMDSTIAAQITKIMDPES